MSIRSRAPGYCARVWETEDSLSYYFFGFVNSKLVKTKIGESQYIVNSQVKGYEMTNR